MTEKRPSFPARLQPAAPARSVALASPASSAQRRLVPAPSSPAATAAVFDSLRVRQRMVRRLSDGGIRSAAVLAAMSDVERHCFVDSALANQSYEDTSLPIGLGQTISKPSVVARMLELLLDSHIAREGKLGRVLEIGTGCGYQAAVLARLASEVYSIERLRGLHERARVNLRPLRLANVHLLFGDGMLGFPSGAPYACILAAAGGAAVPPAWCDQLAVGGRLVAPVADRNGTQSLMVIDRHAHGWKESSLEVVHFVPLKSGTA